MDILQNNNILDLKVTEETKSEFNGLAQWMNINAIIALVSLGISIISTLITVAKMSRYGGSGGGAIFGMLISASISILMNLTLIASAKNINAGIAGSDQGLFNVGMNKLKTYFLIYGIVMIVVMVLVLLLTLIILVAASRQGF